MSFFSGPVDPVTLVTSLTALATAVGVAIKNARARRRERELVDELEQTGVIQRRRRKRP